MERVYLSDLVSHKPDLVLSKREEQLIDGKDVDSSIKQQLQFKEEISRLLKDDLEVLEKQISSVFKCFQSSMSLNTNDFSVLFTGEKNILVQTLVNLVGIDESEYSKITQFEVAAEKEEYPATIKQIAAFLKANSLTHEDSSFYNDVGKTLKTVLKNIGQAMDKVKAAQNRLGEYNEKFVVKTLRYSLSLSILAIKLLVLLKPLFNGIHSRLLNESSFKALALTKDVNVAVKLTQPMNQTVQTFQLKNLLPVTKEFVDTEIACRTLQPGAYIVLGGPMTGKSLLIDSMFQHMKNSLPSDSVPPLLSIFEPSDGNKKSLVLWEEISIGISVLLASASPIIGVDSLRFLNAASPYPAKRMGINSGLEIYATQLNEICCRVNKIGVFILSTSDMSRDVTEAYKSLLVGSTQGIIIPSRIDPMMYEKNEAPIEISLRNGDRTYTQLRYTTVEPLRSMIKRGGDDFQTDIGVGEMERDIYSSVLM